MTAVSITLAAVRAALVLGAALAAMRLLRKRSAATRRSVLVGGFAIVLALPVATALLPALHLRDRAEPASLVPAAPPEEIVEASAVAVVPSMEPVHAAISPAPEPATPLSPLVVIGGLWALGALAVLARLGVGLARARRLARSARFVETLDVAGKPVEVRISSEISTPAVTGLIVPVVLLPRDAATWTAERRRIVLAHELAHIASRDCLASAIAQLAVAIHWFDPLVWIAARRLRIERELAADEQVVDQGVLASSYAEHLLAIATDRAVPIGALAMAESSQVSVRIHALLATRTPRTRLGRALPCAGLALAAVVACATPERDPAPVVETPAPAQPVVATATTDSKIQAIVEDEIERMEKDWGPCAAIVLVMDPHTGSVLAVSHRGGTEATAQLAAARPIIAGSTMKPLVVAAALEEGVIASTDRFDASTEPFMSVTDSEPHGTLDVGEILAVSSNVGLARIFDKLGGAKLATWEKRFHLASAPPTIGDGAAGVPYAIGAKMPTTPLEMAAAFSALANGGIYHAPAFVPQRDAGERVVRADTAATVLSLLEGVTGDRGTAKAARVQGVRVAGKTGTVHMGTGKDTNDYYSSFVGTAPLEAPRYVIFVGAETPKNGGTGGQVAAPVFGRVMARLLAR